MKTFCVTSTMISAQLNWVLLAESRIAGMWNKDYGTETCFLVLDYGFNGLGLHNSVFDSVTFNERAIEVYKRVGFREIGRRREAHSVGNRAFDLVLMDDCLATEFKSLLKPVIDLP